MIFLPDSVYRSRQRLLKQEKAGKISRKAMHEQMLELDPDDHFSLLELGQIAEKAGDRTAAGEYYWRAIESHPWAYQNYMALSQLLNKEPGQEFLAAGLAELGLRKLLLDHEALHDLASKRWDVPVPGLEKLQSLSKREQYEFFAEAFGRQKAEEPADVTARLRPHRLAHQLQESTIDSESAVNAIIAEGPLITPLLQGLLRGVAQNFVEDDSGAERALALLGEIGDPAVLPDLLEFASLDDALMSGVGSWAIDRVMTIDPQGAAAVLRELAPGLDSYGRTVAAINIVTHPELDPDGAILSQILSDLKGFGKPDRDALVGGVVQGLLARRGPAALEPARQLLAAHAASLSPRLREICEEELRSVEEGIAPAGEVPAPPEITVYQICSGEVNWEDDDDEYEDEEDVDDVFDEDEEWIPEPVHKAPTPGRNDPCWCGSGKKYKKCHLAADEQAQQRPSGPPPDEFDGLRRRIGRLMESEIPREELREAIAELAGDSGDDPDPMAIGDWIIHDRVSPRLGRTVIDEFLRREGSRLSSREREIVESWSRSSFGLYEVQEVKPGRGAEVKDLLRGDTLFLHDISLSRHIVRWDGILCRVVDGTRGRELTGVSLTIPRMHLDRMRRWLEEDRRDSGLEWPQYFKRNLPRIMRTPTQLNEEWLEELRLANSAGEPLLFSTATYELPDSASVVAALDTLGELTSEDSGKTYRWLADASAEGSRTVLGTIKVEDSKLTLECNSRERLERGKELLSRAAGSGLRHLRDDFTTAKEVKRQATAGEGRPARQDTGLSPEEEHQVITEVLDRHYATWTDQPLPALKGKTPRQAVKTATGREQVSALLRDIENREERKRKEGQPFFDVDRLREALGLRG